MKDIHKLYSDICFNTYNQFEINYDFFKNHFEQFLLLNFKKEVNSRDLAISFVGDFLYRYDTLPRQSVYSILISQVAEYFENLKKEK